MTQRTTLVTGATRGIGRASALALAQAGHHVIATGRTQGALEELDDAITAAGGTCTLVPFDIRERDSINQLALVIHERYGHLDGLFANAGVLGEMTPAPHVTPKIWDEVISVNLTANVDLIRAFDPLLRASPAGRAVFVTSGVAQSRRAYWSAYAASKAGLEAFVQSYAREIEITSLRVNLLNPGATATAMRAKAMPGEDPCTLPQPEDVAGLVVEMLSEDYDRNAEVVSYREWSREDR